MGTTTTQDQLAKLRADLDKLRRQSVRSAWGTLIVGTVLLALLATYFYVGYTNINAATEPEGLVALADSMIDDNIPTFRQTAVEEIKKAAPQLASTTSKQIQQAIPDFRKRLESYALEQMDKSLKESQLLSEKQFTEYLRANRPFVQQKIKELSTSENLVDSEIQELVKSIENQYAVSFRAQSEEALHTLLAMNEKLAHLKIEKGLLPDEQIERRILMGIRRLQTEKVDPHAGSISEEVTGLTPPTPKPVTPSRTAVSPRPAPPTTKAAAPATRPTPATRK